MKTAYKTCVYGSGFIGFDINITERKVTRPSTTKMLVDSRFNKPPMSKPNYELHNDRVSDLYDRLITQTSDMTSFTFKDEIVTTALTAFGTQNFNTWVMLQNSSPFVTREHARFIMETLAFIAGTPRQISLSVWQRILKKRQENQQPRLETPIDPSAFFRDINPDFTFSGLQQSRSDLGAIVAEWTSRPRGFEDMLWSLNVIFGKVEMPRN